MQVDLIIKGGVCVSHRGQHREDIAVRDGMIVAIGDLSSMDAIDVIDADGLHILPGVIDSEFHVSRDFENDTAAAVTGGVTSVLCVTSESRIGGGFYCDHAYFKNVTRANISELFTLEKEDGCAGIHLVMGATGDFEVIADDRTLLEVLKNGNRRVVVHSEDQDRLNARETNIEAGDVSSHNKWHDEKVAIDATRRILAIARGAGRPVHLQHVSTDKEMALIAAYKDIATAAVSSSHLFLSAPDCYDHFHNYVKFDPPVRGEENRIGLWKALTTGVVDVLASAHMPILVNEKDKNYPTCPSGAPSVQTMLTLMLDQVNKGAISLEMLIDMTSAGPARIFNITTKGRIAVGYDADFAVVDLKKEWVLDDEDVQSGCGWDIHAGCNFTGQVIGTIIRGEKIMWDGKIIAPPLGRAIKFYDTFKEYDPE